MRKHNCLATLLMASIISVIVSFLAFASPKTTDEAATSFHAVDSRAYKEGIYTKLRFYKDTFYDEWNDALVKLWNRTFPECSPAEISPFYYDWDRDYHVYAISEEEMQLFIDRQDAVEKWALSVTKNIIPDNSSRDVAVQEAFSYLVSNFYYDCEASEHQELLNQAQGAYYLIMNGKGVCASFSKAFRALVESISFDPGTGNVSWGCANPFFLQVAIVRNNSHEWTAIQDTDGTWYHYDVSTCSSYGKKWGEWRYFHVAEKDLHDSFYNGVYENPSWYY